MFQSRRKANTYRNIGALFLIPALLLLLLGLIHSVVDGINVIIIYVTFIILASISIFFFENYETWSTGAQGEEKVAEYLSLLNDRYHVIHDVVLPGEKGNIDHIVLGPNGIFVVETKNHKGYITCQGDWWRQRKIGRRGTPYLGNIGSPSKQVKRKAVLLSKIIQNHFKINLYIISIVVFTNEEANLKIINPTVAVLRPQELSNFIQYYRSTSKGIKLEKLESLLKQHSYFS